MTSGQNNSALVPRPKQPMVSLLWQRDVEFADNGLMQRRFASINDLAIKRVERTF